MSSEFKKGQKLPRVRNYDYIDFLVLWNTLHDQYRDDEKHKKRLTQIAEVVELKEIARLYLTRRSAKRVMVGVLTCGHLKDVESWNELIRITLSRRPLISLVALRSLFLIDPKKAIHVFIGLSPTRDEWPASMVASILREGGKDKISSALCNAVIEADRDQAVLLIPYLVCCYRDDALNAISLRMATTTSDRIIGMCLKVIGSYGKENELKFVRQHTDNKRWHIRAQVARALGRIGTKEDLQVLVNYLHDPQWWVRYRSARALSSLPFVDLRFLKQMQEKQTDQYGRDMLAQVIAEKIMVKPNDLVTRI